MEGLGKQFRLFIYFFAIVIPSKKAKLKYISLTDFILLLEGPLAVVHLEVVLGQVVHFAFAEAQDALVVGFSVGLKREKFVFVFFNESSLWQTLHSRPDRTLQLTWAASNCATRPRR